MIGDYHRSQPTRAAINVAAGRQYPFNINIKIKTAELFSTTEHIDCSTCRLTSVIITNHPVQSGLINKQQNVFLQVSLPIPLSFPILPFMINKSLPLHKSNNLLKML
jgi:hypothetical protein